MDDLLLHSIIVKTMMQDEWASKYDPDNLFNVDQYAYGTEEEYLCELRKKWKAKLDHFCEYEDIVYVEDYADYNEYEEAIEEAEKRKSWSATNDNNHTCTPDPLSYDTKKDYINDLRALWSEQLDPFNEHDVDVNDYDKYEDYYEAIINMQEIENDHISNDDVHIDMLRQKWQVEYDPYARFTDASCYYDLDSFLASLKSSWAEYADPNDEFDYVDPDDYDSFDEYIEDLRIEWQQEYDPYGDYDFIDTEEYECLDEYKEALDEAKQIQ